MGRFISSDTYPSTGQGLLGNNMFAYCNNNPVIYSDSGGTAVETVLDIISLANSINDVVSNPSNPWAWAGLVGDIVDLAVPCLGGVGETVKAFGTTQKVGEGLGDLSKAKEYGIKAYNSLKKALKGTGLEAHHVVEKRLVKYLGIDSSSMLSVAVTKSEHQKFTNAWRGIIKYGTDYSTLGKDEIYAAAKAVYKDYPDLIQAAYTTLFD